MAKKKAQRKKDYTAVGVIAASLMVAVTVFFGWRAVNFMNPPVGDKDADTTGNGTGRAYLVYRSYKVLDRGIDAGPTDDTVSCEFFRYPLDGSASVGESIAKEVREGAVSSAGVPWMSKVSDSVLLFVRRASDVSDVIWIDASGNEIRKAADAPDVVWRGLPSPDGRFIAYSGGDAGSLVIEGKDGSRAEHSIPMPEDARAVPFAWTTDAVALFVRTGPAGEVEGGSIPGLWRLDLRSGSATEVAAVAEFGLEQLDIDPSSGKLVGVTYACESLETCGSAPSSLYMVDTVTGESVAMLSSDSHTYGQPKFSPDGARIAYVMANGSADVWVADAAVSGHERRVVSGQLLDWTPDGAYLVVDRDNEIQLVSVSDGASRTVVRRSGKYQDPDFHGVDYVGIIVKR